MKRALFLLPILLAGCNSGPSVTAQNASADEVNAKLAQSGVTVSMQPGRWQGVVTVHEMTIPGLPPEAAARMKADMGKGKPTTSCLTQEEAKKPLASFFSGDDENCRYDHFTMTGGAIDAAMTCKEKDSTQEIAMKGKYSADTYHVDMSTKSTGTGPMANSQIAMTVDAKRVGECNGSEDEADS